MLKILGACVGLVLVIIFALPFAIETYHRYEVAQRLKPLMNDRERAAFQEWQGDAISFGRSLYERCQLTHGQDSPDCQPYKAAIQ
jgi:hypothetical protein